MNLSSLARSRAIRTVALLVPLAALLLSLGGATGAAESGRVVVLGFDGADARTVQKMIDAGELPNLAELAEEGTFAPLVSTNPAESAAGWAAINTGTNPVKNNVPSFIKRTLPSMAPGFAHIETGTKPIDELEPTGLVGLLNDYDSGVLAGGLGLAGLLMTLLVLKVLLRVGTGLSVALGILVGGGAGFAATMSKSHVPGEVPEVYSNLVSQPGFWDHAAEGGKRSIVLDAALAFGRPETKGARVLAGLGLPDIRGGSNGNWFVYTTDPDAELEGDVTGSNTGTVYRVEEDVAAGRIETVLHGPVNFTRKAELEAGIAAVNGKIENATGWKEAQALRDQKAELERDLKSIQKGNGGNTSVDSVRAQLPLVIERRGDDRVALTIGSQTHEVGEGEWTDWYQLCFELNPLIAAHAVTRARVVSIADPLTIYINSLDIDPENPPFWQPISQPAGFSKELASWIGMPYETLGWACMTNQLKDKEMPVDVFLEDIEFTMDWRRRLTRASLERDDWELLFSVFSTTDRVQHMMYRFHDPEHPRHDVEEAAREVDFFDKPTSLADTIPEIYRQMDDIVGEVRASLRPEDTLILCADHGFTSYRRGIEVNNWLIQAGYMKLKDGLTSTRGNIMFNVDWEETRAYSLGLGMVYVNMEGREPNGIVPRDEAKDLLHEIGSRMVAEALDAGPDDAPYAEPRPSVLDYDVMDELYTGETAWYDPAYPCADMQLGFAEFYRMSWNAVGGGIRLKKNEDGDIVLGDIFRNNTNNWSGDHASNSPNLVTGIFFSSKPIEMPESGVSVLHIAPTVLDLLGVDEPASLDLPPLAFR